MAPTANQALKRLAEQLSRRSPDAVSAEESARAALPELVRALRDGGAIRVVLFGSLAMGLFRVNSDIDLAVTGLGERALGRLERSLTLRAGRPVGLVNLDTLPASVREQVDRFGEELK